MSKFRVELDCRGWGDRGSNLSQYHSSRLGSSNHYLLHWAVCIPSGCNSQDLKEFLVDNFYGLGQELQVHVNVRDDMCHYDKKVTFDKWDIIFISALFGLRSKYRARDILDKDRGGHYECA
ncbi:unnamed protein product [Timema podura]|uniref:Nose resistant-to-fluoxetine protein N-terminal domain-containing protein n=1 Tax=Timema podura TaxID=61482 RepID=A0ABN7NMW7_TIMPD|nr:unnamed protein product [Timema podura]